MVSAVKVSGIKIEQRHWWIGGNKKYMNVMGDGVSDERMNECYSPGDSGE